MGKNMNSFNDFGLPPALLTALEAMEFKSPTPIQAQAIPAALLGKDILAIAPTGTGKTGAFGIPALAFLYPQPGKQVLVLAPTRELAAQIHKFIRKLGETLNIKSTLISGGESYRRQRDEVKAGADVIIATPGRLMEHIDCGMPLEKISVLVLDEVDRMLDMGFAPQVEQIVKRLGPERQTFLFSATMPPEILKLANKYLKDPVRVQINQATEKPKITEETIDTNDVEKPRLLQDHVEARPGKILIFANTQGRVEQVARRLTQSGQPAGCMHGGRTHGERKMALESFRTGQIRILVATDVAARGIDVSDIETVINYDYPATQEDYLHRIGRTGRIGREGTAISFMDPRRRPRGYRRPPVAGAFGKRPPLKRPLQRFTAHPPAAHGPVPAKAAVAPKPTAPQAAAATGAKPDFKPRPRPQGEFRPSERPERPRGFKPGGFKPRGERPERPAFKPRGDRPAFRADDRRPGRPPFRRDEREDRGRSLKIFREGEEIRKTRGKPITFQKTPGKPFTRSTMNAVRRPKPKHPSA